MIYFSIIITCLLLIFALDSRRFNMVVFNAVWAVTLIINSACFDVIDEPSFRSVLYIVVFILMVNIGAFSNKNAISITLTNKTPNYLYDYTLNKKRFIIINAIVTGYFIYKYTLKSIQITNTYGLFQTRLYAYTSDLNYFGSTLDLYLAQQIIYAFFYASMIIGIIEMMKGKQKHGWINLIGVIEMALYSFTFKGRSAVFAIVFYVISALYIRFHHTENTIDTYQKKKSIKRRILPLLILVGVYIVSLSLSRFGGTTQLKKFFIIYFGGSVTFFSKLIDTAKVTYRPLFFTFSGILDFIKLAINALLGTDMPIGGNEIGIYIDGATQIGGGLSINAMCTSVFYFYLEFGIISIVLGGLILGYVSSMIQRRYELYPNTRNYMLYLLMLYLLFYTYSGWALKYLYFWLVPVIYRLFNTKGISQDEKNLFR